VTTKPVQLSPSELQLALKSLPGWSVDDKKLHRDYVFLDFVAAFGFMTGAALVAERLNHSPEWFNSWNEVRVDLSTHDAGGISALDVKLAVAMEELAKRQPAK
jgi:4a-hydroxytetrahydrobiopterin dehydratase